MEMLEEKLRDVLAEDMFGASLLRFCRLIRLVRVVTPGAAEKRGRGLLALGHVHAVGWIHSLGHPGIL